MAADYRSSIPTMVSALVRRSTQSVENPVETAGQAPFKPSQIKELIRFALRDSSATGARDLRGGRTASGWV